MEQRIALLAVVCLLLVSACANQPKKSESQTERPPPKLLAPSVRKIWIPPVVKDGGQEWEEGHYLYRIERGTTWSR